MAFKSATSLWVQEDRTVPTTGALTMGFAFAWGATAAEVNAAAQAVQPTLSTPCVVPRALNMTIAQARDAFRKAGCVLGTSKKEPSTKFKKFKIKAPGLPRPIKPGRTEERGSQEPPRDDPRPPLNPNHVGL